jgi:hypothetical protein
MRPSDEKVQAHRAAKDMLAQNKDELLRYVALEVRRCIEAVVYEKLEAYRNWIPEKIAKTWQPPLAFKALLEIDPGAEDDMAIGAAIQTRPDLPPEQPPKIIGVDYRPKVKWLNAKYHKLGAHLHADSPFARPKNDDDKREFYEKTLADLEPFIGRSFSFAFSNTTSFECSQCGGTVVASDRGLRELGYATCLKCWLRHSVREEEGRPVFYLEEPSFVCGNCQSDVFVPSNEVRAGYKLTCRKCGWVYEAIHEQFSFQRVTDNEPAPD